MTRSFGTRTRLASALLALGLVLPLLGGCATAYTARALETRLGEIGRTVRGLQRPLIFEIHAGNRLEALTLLADARNEPRRRLSLDLAQQISLAKTRRVHFVVGGPFASLNEQIVSNALDYHEGKSLPCLLYTSDAADE